MKPQLNGPHTRRGFLFASGVGALQAAGNPQRIRTAVYGIGHAHAMGKIRALRKLEQFEFVGICEPDKSEPRDHEVLQGVRWLSEKELLQDPSIELIAVESAVKPNLAYAHQALDAGAFVHLDKPPGEDWESLKELLAKARRRKRVVQMGYQWRYHPAMEAAIEAFREGWLGRARTFRWTASTPALLLSCLKATWTAASITSAWSAWKRWRRFRSRKVRSMPSTAAPCPETST